MTAPTRRKLWMESRRFHRITPTALTLFLLCFCTNFIAADDVIESGADIVVTGTIAENNTKVLKDIIKTVNGS